MSDQNRGQIKKITIIPIGDYTIRQVGPIVGGMITVRILRYGTDIIQTALIPASMVTVYAE